MDPNPEEAAGAGASAVEAAAEHKTPENEEMASPKTENQQNEEDAQTV